jgi:GNAT superfamily N-acetyltransferase
MLKKLALKSKTPAGFFFKVSQGTYGDTIIKLYKRFKNSNRKIGQIRLVNEGKKQYATHSNLDYRYHHKGLGALMYSKAIEWCLQRGYRCKSSGYSSEDAKRVWQGKTIRKYFDIKVKQTESGTWANPDYQTWFAYEKKVRRGPSPKKRTSQRKESRLR